jgi:hypothetical protein
MKRVSTESKLNGIAQQFPQLASQMAMVWDVAMNLRSCSDEPMTLAQRQFNAHLLEQAYFGVASITGLDPCEQFEETKARLAATRAKRTSCDS